MATETSSGKMPRNLIGENLNVASCTESNDSKTSLPSDSTTLSVLQPIEPVDPRIAIPFGVMLGHQQGNLLLGFVGVY